MKWLGWLWRQLNRYSIGRNESVRCYLDPVEYDKAFAEEYFKPDTSGEAEE